MSGIHPPRRERTHKAFIVTLVILACIAGIGAGAVLMRLGLLAPESVPKFISALGGPTGTPSGTPTAPHPNPQPHAHAAGPHRLGGPGLV